jgi:hypothetical protein
MGDIQAIPLRGAWTGNRGILHSGRQIVRFHASDLWITCALQFRGRYHPDQWLPHHYTFLYFHDEAVSFAAGHRPCAECRHADYGAYQRAWAEGLGVRPPSAKEMNRQLHGERIVRGTHRRRTHAMRWADLPDGAFVRIGDATAIIVGDELTEWTREGYGTARARPWHGIAAVITPPSTVAALRAGYPVQIDDTARGGGRFVGRGSAGTSTERSSCTAPETFARAVIALILTIAKDLPRSTVKKFTEAEKFTWCARCVGCGWPERAIARRQQGLTTRISGPARPAAHRPGTTSTRAPRSIAARSPASSGSG